MLDAAMATAQSGLLRISTAGSVDDGKSTLIGRLLLDSKQVLSDQLAQVEETSRRRGFDRTELAFLTDGLRAEREQGITIDVAYRYFATPQRAFIVADTPGHPQYTRNMVTGASTADVAIVLVDARNGLTEQSRRHATLSALLGIRHVVLCVNKMDLVGWSHERFHAIVEEFTAFTGRLGGLEATAIPIAALHGDNVVAPSDRLPWYTGPSLLEHLHTVELRRPHEAGPFRLPVQWVIRPQSDAYSDYRGYAGRVAGGTLAPGDPVLVLPGGQRTTVTALDTYDGPLESAAAPQSLTVRLRDDIDVSRGDLLVDPTRPPALTRELTATVCWMSERALVRGRRYLMKHTTRSVRVLVDELVDCLDVNALERGPQPPTLGLTRSVASPARRRPTGTRPLRREPGHRIVHPHRRGRQSHRGRRAPRVAPDRR